MTYSYFKRTWKKAFACNWELVMTNHCNAFSTNKLISFSLRTSFKCTHLSSGQLRTTSSSWLMTWNTQKNNYLLFLQFRNIIISNVHSNTGWCPISESWGQNKCILLYLQYSASNMCTWMQDLSNRKTLMNVIEWNRQCIENLDLVTLNAQFKVKMFIINQDGLQPQWLSYCAL